MKIIQLNPNNIKNIFIENLSNSKISFVFSTDIVKNSWIDWIITHSDITGTDAVPFERFLAWDDFKRKFLSAQQNNLTTIPTLLKKFFVSDLISKNALKPFEARFQKIINPKDEFSSTADSFTDWICKNLSSLHFWKNKLDKYSSEYGELDQEDKDYLYIYEEYSKFLAENQLFEPFWVENIEFSEKNHEYIIFYPEQFLDFPDFLPILEKSENISLCVLQKDLPSPTVHAFPDARKELRTTMLRIIDLVKNKKADWSEIALSIPNIDLYRPYIEREFNLYNIPFIIKSGISLTKNCAGQIFQEIYNCYNSNFTFDSLRTLLLDEYIPWKEELKQKREDLIREGNRMRCICSPYEKDVWLSAFNSKISRCESKDETDFYTELKDFYQKLQHCIKKFFTFSEESSKFENIRRTWMEFKSSFLNVDDFSQESNNILSRCIKELEEIINIEKDYSSCNLNIKSPYEFFLQVLNEKTYTPQTDTTGVQIFKYKVSAAANFKYQFVIDASQKNLEVSYKRLVFLNTTKRTKLHLLEDDKNLNASDVYIKLYNKTSDSADENFVHFSCSTDSFSGYAINHSLLKKADNYPILDEKDYILHEKNAFITSTYDFSEITQNQKEMFENWKDSKLVNEENYCVNNQIIGLINSRKDKNSQLPSISARGDFENFYPCPRKWIFKSILKFHDDSLDTSLMQNYDMGNLNHKIIELFLNNFVNAKLPYFDEKTSLFMEEEKNEGDLNGDFVDCTEKIRKLLSDSIDSAIFLIKDFRDSPLVIQTLKDQKNQIYSTFFSLLTKFLLPFENGKFGGCTVEALEKQFLLQKEDFCFNGRIDTILRTPDNDFIIIDYKNSKSSMPAAGELLVNENGILKDFQMPLYYKLVTETTKNDIFSMHYYVIKTNEILNVIIQGDKKRNPEIYQDTVSRIEDYAHDFVQKISTYKFTPYQSNNNKEISNVSPFENCSKCSFKTICRTTYTIGKKEIDSLEDING